MRKSIALLLCTLCAMFSEAQLQPMYKIFQGQLPKDREQKFLPDSLPELLETAPINADQPTNSVKRYLLNMPYVIDMNDKTKDRLISDYSFRRLIQSDFSKTIVGMDNVSKINRYASLDISDKPAFDFTPLTWSDNPKYKVFQNMLSINISGKMNSDGFVDLKKLRDLTLKVNAVHIFNWTNYKPKEKISSLKDKLKCDMKQDIEDLCEKYNAKFKALSDASCITGDELETKKKALASAFRDEFAELETKAAEAYWSSKNYYWLSANIGIKRDKVDFVSQDDLDQNKYDVHHETIFVPEALASFNTLHLYANGASIMGSVWGAIKQKHSLSEVYSPDDFQPYYQVDGTTLQLKDKESVFVTDFTSIDTKWKPDFGARLVLMSRYRKSNNRQSIGLAIAASRKGLVHTSSSAALYRVETGLVFPFLKEDGVSKFNLEFFHRWDEFSKFPNEDERTWGFRFNVPITN